MKKSWIWSQKPEFKTGSTYEMCDYFSTSSFVNENYKSTKVHQYRGLDGHDFLSRHIEWHQVHWKSPINITLLLLFPPSPKSEKTKARVSDFEYISLHLPFPLNFSHILCPPWPPTWMRDKHHQFKISNPLNPALGPSPTLKNTTACCFPSWWPQSRGKAAGCGVLEGGGGTESRSQI